MRVFPFAFAFLATTAQAEVPKTVTDIPPVHSLVAAVMKGVGTPELLLQSGGSAHGHQMRPSEAAALDQADILFWIGSELSPWVDTALDKMGLGLTSVSLIDVEGTYLRQFAHKEDHEEHHGHEDHDEHDDHGEHADHDKHKDHDGHGEHEGGHHAGDGHDHSGVDPHVWLDPQNALIWLPKIAAILAEKDPDHRDSYFENAKVEGAKIESLLKQTQDELSDVDGNYIVFHDAYGYFSDRFGMAPAGAIADSEATPPGARRLAELHEIVKNDDVRCLFTEPQFDGAVADRMAETLGVKVGVLDPIGSGMKPGPDLYSQLIEGVAHSLTECLTQND